MNLEQLKTKSRDELKEIADKLNIKVHHKHSDETIIQKIMQQPIAYQNNALKHVAEFPQEAVHFNTYEQIYEVIKPYADKEGYEILRGVDKETGEFDNTLTFRFRGAEECVNMSVPLRVIKMKAESVSRGARRPLAFSPTDGFDTSIGRGYAANVLM